MGYSRPAHPHGMETIPMNDVETLKQKLLQLSQEVVDAESGTDLRQKLKKLREITTEFMSAAEVEEG